MRGEKSNKIIGFLSHIFWTPRRKANKKKKKWLCGHEIPFLKDIQQRVLKI